MESESLRPRSHLFTARLWLEPLGEGQTEWRGPVPGFAWRFAHAGVEFSGQVIGPTIWYPTLEWKVEVRSDYFLDPPRMPATGEPFISLPKVTFEGGLGLVGGGMTTIGEALCQISF